MIDPDFSAYIQALPPQDRLTVEQALRGLQRVLAPNSSSAEIIDLIEVVREREPRPAA